MIGNKVILKGVVDSKPLYNLTGTILCINETGNILVAIDNWNRGHKGYTNDIPNHLRHLNTGKNCWWISPYNITVTSGKTKEQLIIDKINYLDKKFKERKSNVVKQT